MDRMPGRVGQPWCPACHTRPGPCCPVKCLSTRQVRRQLKRETDREYEDATNDLPTWK